MICFLVAVAVQASSWQTSPVAPTVGDTVRLWRQVPMADQVAVMPDPLATTDVVQPLADPVARLIEGRLLLEYELTFFAPGEHAITIPSVELVHTDGSIEVLPGETVPVLVRSVLPSAEVEPKASLGPYASSPRDPLILVALVAAVLGATVIWGVRRRAVATRPGWVFEWDRRSPSPLETWVSAGEGRAVVALVSDAMRDRIASQVPECGTDATTEECLAILARVRPDWPLGEIGDVLRHLDRARFAPAVSGDVQELVMRAEDLIRDLERGGHEEAA